MANPSFFFINACRTRVRNFIPRFLKDQLFLVG